MKPSGMENPVGRRGLNWKPPSVVGEVWKSSGGTQISVNSSQSTSGIMLLRWLLQITFFEF